MEVDSCERVAVWGVVLVCGLMFARRGAGWTRWSAGLGLCGVYVCSSLLYRCARVRHGQFFPFRLLLFELSALILLIRFPLRRAPHLNTRSL